MESLSAELCQQPPQNSRFWILLHIVHMVSMPPFRRQYSTFARIFDGASMLYAAPKPRVDGDANIGFARPFSSLSAFPKLPEA